MLCLPLATLPTDFPYWVTREDFMAYFDQTDYLCRDARVVKPNYCSSWFNKVDNGTLEFYLPTVQVIEGKTQFINGRHRTAVLFSQIEKIPIAFTKGVARDLAERLQFSPVNMDQYIALPDLPFVDCEDG